MEGSGEYESCAVCGRTILRGEVQSPYLNAERQEVGVCALCKPRAEVMGWVPAALADTVTEPAGPRRRLALAAGLRERLARAGVAARPRDRRQDDQPAEPTQEPAEEPAPQAESASQRSAEPKPPKPPPDPLEAFNASEEARKVAGLAKSLGEPRVTVRADVITVAWELSWYQWRVRGDHVREIARGTDISELPDPHRAWNATAAADGTLSLA